MANDIKKPERWFFFFFFLEFTRAVMKGKGHPQNLLGSKDLGTNVFRTLMCNVGKSWSKQVLVLFLDWLKVCVLM